MQERKRALLRKNWRQPDLEQTRFGNFQTCAEIPVFLHGCGRGAAGQQIQANVQEPMKQRLLRWGEIARSKSRIASDLKTPRFESLASLRFETAIRNARLAIRF